MRTFRAVFEDRSFVDVLSNNEEFARKKALSQFPESEIVRCLSLSRR